MGAARNGYLFGIVAYLCWGLFPLYWKLLRPSDALEILAHRIVWSFLAVAIVVTVARGWRRIGGLLRQPRKVTLVGLAAVLIAVNWWTYIYGVNTDRVVETSLGYFINPLVTVLLGVIVLREKVRPAQWVALGIAAVAILVIVVGYGSFPWIALVLAFSFAAYGLVKRVVGPTVDALGGLTLETAWLAPIAVVQLVVVGLTGGLAFGSHGPAHTIALLAAGVVTTVPLLLFAAGARRIPLVVLGMTQFLTPVIQFLLGWLVLKEAMPAERWIGFALVWLALVVLMSDMILASRSPRERLT